MRHAVARGYPRRISSISHDSLACCFAFLKHTLMTAHKSSIAAVSPSCNLRTHMELQDTPSIPFQVGHLLPQTCMAVQADLLEVPGPLLAVDALDPSDKLHLVFKTLP